MAIKKGWSGQAATIDSMMKKGYTPAHKANAKRKKFKANKSSAQIGPQNNDNNAATMEGQM